MRTIFDAIPEEVFLRHVVTNLVLKTETPVKWVSQYLVSIPDLDSYLWQVRSYNGLAEENERVVEEEGGTKEEKQEKKEGGCVVA
jgi:hypothetical protein